jgi:2-polyprenyl-3-methyl-5-hydroxy-6-metoxy-1,4-benzoquinol methylase
LPFLATPELEWYNTVVNSAQTSVEKCLFCGNESFAPLHRAISDRLGFVPGKWGYDECTHCQSAILTPFPRAEQIPNFYPPVYTFAPELAQRRGFLSRLWATLEYQLFYAPMYRTQTKLVLRHIGWQQKAGALLDVGCGKGLRLVAFRNKGLRPFGFDFQPQAVKYLTESLGIPACSGNLDDIVSIFKGQQFDLITAFYVFEHVVDVKKAFRDLYELLKPGGSLVVAVPLIDSLQSRILKSRWSSVCEAPRHITNPSQKGIAQACSEAGFESISLAPDSTLSCAGALGLSLVPAATTTHLYADAPRWYSYGLRLLSAVVTFLVIPYCLFESYVLKRPPLALLVSRRPLVAKE